jgi:hypothetical protein
MTRPTCTPSSSPPVQPQLIDGPTWGQLHLDFMDRLRGLPGVEAVGVVNNIPLG